MMIHDLSQLRFVGLNPAAPMRQVHAAQVGVVNMHQMPDVTAVTSACTLVVGEACTCVQHPFAFTSQRLVTVPIDNETRERMINSQCIWYATSSLDMRSIGSIKWNGAELVYQGCHISTRESSWPLSEDPSVQCVVNAPISMIEKVHIGCTPYCMHACTRYHFDTPSHKKMCQRACMIVSKHPSVAHVYALNYVSLNVRFELSGALLGKMQLCAISGVIANIDEFIKVYMPASIREATLLIRECAWAVQRLIMIGMKDQDCIWSRVPKDVCKLIHRVVFA